MNKALNNSAQRARNALRLPAFRYHGVVLDPAQLRYSPHPDIIQPSVIETGSGWENPLAKYYMYYAPHDAPGGICLALADHPEDPWREYLRNPVIGHQWPPLGGVSDTVHHAAACDRRFGIMAELGLNCLRQAIGVSATSSAPQLQVI